MRRRAFAALLALSACKAELTDTLDAAPDVPALGSDASTQDGPATLGPWGTPQPVAGASDATLNEDDGTLSSTMLELVFKRVDAGDANLYVMTRASTSSPWSTPAPLDTLNTTTTNEESPRFSSDDLTLYFGSSGDIYKTTRSAVGQPWSLPAPVTALNTVDFYEKWAAVCPGGYAIVSRSTAANGQDLYEGTESAGANTALTTQNTANNEQGTFISNDCLHLYFQSDRDGDFNLYDATRPTTSAAWSNPTKLADFNAVTTVEEDPWISTDEHTFLYASNQGGTKDLYLVTR